MSTFGAPGHPGSSSETVSRRMSVAARRGTAPEMALRRELHARGRRYRVCYPVPGASRLSIDIAFIRARLAVFVDGCYWHGCPAHGTRPQSNSSWWVQKFAANKARDEDTNSLLEEEGWRVLRLWEHPDVSEGVDLLESLLDA